MRRSSHDLDAVPSRRAHERPRRAPVLGAQRYLISSLAQPSHRCAVIVDYDRSVAVVRRDRSIGPKQMDLSLTALQPRSAATERWRRFDRLKPEQSPETDRLLLVCPGGLECYMLDHCSDRSTATCGRSLATRESSSSRCETNGCRARRLVLAECGHGSPRLR